MVEPESGCQFSIDQDGIPVGVGQVFILVVDHLFVVFLDQMAAQVGPVAELVNGLFIGSRLNAPVFGAIKQIEITLQIEHPLEGRASALFRLYKPNHTRIHVFTPRRICRHEINLGPSSSRVKQRKVRHPFTVG